MLRVAIGILIADFCEFLNVSRPMKGSQISSTVDLILEFYDHLKLEDFVRCFKFAKLYKYGKFYEGIDGGKIMDFIGKYDLDREQEVMDYRKTESDNHKRTCNVLPQEFLPILKKFEKKIDVKKERLLIPKIDENERQIQMWMKQFDKIHKRNPFKFPNQSGGTGIRMIKRYHRHLTVENYLKYKLEQLKRVDLIIKSKNLEG